MFWASAGARKAQAVPLERRPGFAAPIARRGFRGNGGEVTHGAGQGVVRFFERLGGVGEAGDAEAFGFGKGVEGRRRPPTCPP